MCWGAHGWPREGFPRGTTAPAQCSASLRISARSPGPDFGEEGEGPTGAWAVCSRDTCRVPRWELLCGDLAALLLGLSVSPFTSPSVRHQQLPEQHGHSPGSGPQAELPSPPAQLHSWPNPAASPSGSPQHPVQPDSGTGERSCSGPCPCSGLPQSPGRRRADSSVAGSAPRVHTIPVLEGADSHASQVMF